jgi:hypothetical protein
MGIIASALKPLLARKVAVADTSEAPAVARMTAAQRHFYAGDTGMTAHDREHREVQLRRQLQAEYPGLDVVPVEQQFPGWRVRIGDFVIVDKQTREVVAGDLDGQSLNLDDLEAWIVNPITDIEATAARETAEAADGDGGAGDRGEVVTAIVRDLRVAVDKNS